MRSALLASDASIKGAYAKDDPEFIDLTARRYRRVAEESDLMLAISRIPSQDADYIRATIGAAVATAAIMSYGKFRRTAGRHDLEHYFDALDTYHGATVHWAEDPPAALASVVKSLSNDRTFIRDTHIGALSKSPLVALHDLAELGIDHGQSKEQAIAATIQTFAQQLSLWGYTALPDHLADDLSIVTNDKGQHYFTYGSRIVSLPPAQGFIKVFKPSDKLSSSREDLVNIAARAIDRNDPSGILLRLIAKNWYFANELKREEIIPFTSHGGEGLSPYHLPLLQAHRWLCDESIKVVSALETTLREALNPPELSRKDVRAKLRGVVSDTHLKEIIAAPDFPAAYHRFIAETYSRLDDGMASYVIGNNLIEARPIPTTGDQRDAFSQLFSGGRADKRLFDGLIMRSARYVEMARLEPTTRKAAQQHTTDIRSVFQAEADRRHFKFIFQGLGDPENPYCIPAWYQKR